MVKYVAGHALEMVSEVLSVDRETTTSRHSAGIVPNLQQIPSNRRRSFSKAEKKTVQACYTRRGEGTHEFAEETDRDPGLATVVHSYDSGRFKTKAKGCTAQFTPRPYHGFF